MEERITREDLLMWSRPTNEYSISIFLPTHRAGHEVNEKQDALQFKDLLKKAVNRLIDHGYDINEKDIPDWLKPAYGLLIDENFWYKQDAGLAVFVGEGFFKAIKLPYQVHSDYSVNRYFNVLPLIESIQGDRSFFLLNLHEHAIAFFKGHKYGLSPLTIPELRWSMDDDAHFDRNTNQHRFQVGRDTVVANHTKGFERDSSGLIDEKEYTTAYLKEIDRVLWQTTLQKEHIPLLLAGSKEHVDLYRQVSRYLYVVRDHFIEGFFDAQDRSLLSTKATEQLSHYFKEDERQALDNFGVASSSGLSTVDVEKVVSGAYYGQIADFFVARGAQYFGRFDLSDNVFTPLEEADGEDIIPLLVHQCLDKGGNVFVLAQEDMPAHRLLAATLRFQT